MSNVARGGYTNTTTQGLFINGGSNAQSNDKGLSISMVAGTGIDIAHAGGTALNIATSGSTGLVIAQSSSDPDQPAYIAYKSAGTGYVNRSLHLSNTSLGGLVSMNQYERPLQLTNGGGYSFNYKLNTANGGFIANREDHYWVDVTNASEDSAIKWSVMVNGSISEAMILSSTVKFASLAGTGSRTVVADANGVLSAP